MEYPGGGVQQLIGNMGPGARRDLDLGVIYTQGVIGGHDLPTLKKKKNTVYFISFNLQHKLGFPWWLRWQRICLQCRKAGFNLWVGKIPWIREWQPTPVFLPGKSQGQESGGLQSMGSQSVRYNRVTNTHTQHKLDGMIQNVKNISMIFVCQSPKRSCCC